MSATLPEIAMQHHCIHCKREQYAPLVWDISNGSAACPWCGMWSQVLTPKEFQVLLSWPKETDPNA